MNIRFLIEEDAWKRIDRLVDELEEVALKATDVIRAEEIVKYIKAEMATVYRHVEREGWNHDVCL